MADRAPELNPRFRRADDQKRVLQLERSVEHPAGSTSSERCYQLSSEICHELSCYELSSEICYQLSCYGLSSELCLARSVRGPGLTERSVAPEYFSTPEFNAQPAPS
eukprot:1031736-Rhodomonas_salina.2